MTSTNQVTSTFENWFDSAVSDGLNDIKLAITNTRGASVRLIQEDLMNIDALVSAGRVKDLPEAVAYLTDKQLDIINRVKIA